MFLPRLCLLVVAWCLQLAVTGCTATRSITTVDDSNAAQVIPDARPEFGANDTLVVLVLPSEPELARQHLKSLENVLADNERESLPAEHRYAVVRPGDSSTELLESWMLFKPPTLVFISNYGTDFAFFSSAELSNYPERLAAFLEANTWRSFAKPWAGQLAPGSTLYPLLLKCSPLLKLYYQTPPWAVLVISIGVGQLIQKSLSRDRGQIVQRPSAQAEDKHLHKD